MTRVNTKQSVEIDRSASSGGQEKPMKLSSDIKSTQCTNTRTCRLETYKNYEEAYR